MKKIAMLTGVLACFFAIAVALSSAQTVGLRVDVPFEFNVGGKVLPAGPYLIQAPQGGTLKILGPHGVAALAMTNPISGHGPDGSGQVDFNCYGRRCFLSTFWTGRTDMGQEISKCRIEKDLGRVKEEPVVIALRATPADR